MLVTSQDIDYDNEFEYLPIRHPNFELGKGWNSVNFTNHIRRRSVVSKSIVVKSTSSH